MKRDLSEETVKAALKFLCERRLEVLGYQANITVTKKEHENTGQAERFTGLTERGRRLLRIIRESSDPAALLLFSMETAVNAASGGKEAG